MPRRNVSTAVQSFIAALTLGAGVVTVLVATTGVFTPSSTADQGASGALDSADVVAADPHTHEADGSTTDHAESSLAYDELPRATKSEVDQLIAAYARTYPTAAEAMGDGWFRGTRSLYGIGAHYIKEVRGLSVATPFDLLHPPILLFDGNGPDAKFAGVSYVVAEEGSEGFTGDYDFWHFHSSVCSRGGDIVSLSEDDSEIWYSESECVAAGGRVMPLAADFMIHVWIGPEYIDGAPIFAHDHPELYDGYSPKLDSQ
jgi:hypothetical protein